MFKEKVIALIEQEVQDRYINKCPKKQLERNGRVYMVSDTNAVDQVLALEEILKDVREVVRDMAVQHLGIGQRPKKNKPPKEKPTAAATPPAPPSKPAEAAGTPPKNALVNTKSGKPNT